MKERTETMFELDVTKGIKGRKDACILTGRKIGEKQRKILNIDELEKQYDVIKVIAPEQFVLINSSFFLGLFGKSVRKCGSREKFLEKYSFHVSEAIMANVEEGIRDALREGSGLDA